MSPADANNNIHPKSMNIPKPAHLHIVLLFVIQMLWFGAAHAATPNAPISKEEAAKQAEIYRSRGENVPQNYVIDRSVISYGFTLSPEFNRELASLGPADRWLDIGAGEGQAVLDYYGDRYDAMNPQGREKRGKKAKSVAISIEDRRTPRWQQVASGLEPNQIQYLFGKFLREYTLAELGKFQVITDVLGGFSYTENLSQFMERTLSILEVKGSFHTVLLDVQTEKGTNRAATPQSPFLTSITDAKGGEVSPCSWLKRITCVSVTCDVKKDWNFPIEIYRVHKVCDSVTVPPLSLNHYLAGTPPSRRFQLTSP